MAANEVTEMVATAAEMIENGYGSREGETLDKLADQMMFESGWETTDVDYQDVWDFVREAIGRIA